MLGKDFWRGHLAAMLTVACLMCHMMPTAAIANEADITEVQAISQAVTESEAALQLQENDAATEAQPDEGIITVDGVQSPEPFALTTQDGTGTESVDTVTDTLKHSMLGTVGTGYSEWTYESDESSAVYVGNTAGSFSSIQMNSNNNSGIFTMASAGRLLSIAVEWNTNTLSGQTVNVYGKYEPYESAANLHMESTRGELIGTLVYGDTTTIRLIPEGYDYIGLCSAKGALYLDSITFTWATGDPTAPTYDITVNPSENGSIMTYRQTAPEGVRIALVAKAQDGYMLDTMTVTDADGNEIDVIDNAFVMPDCDVTVDATFTRLPPMTYRDEQGIEHDTGDDLYHFVTSGTTSASGNKLTEGWWVVGESVKLSPRLTVEGDVRLILADGATLTAAQGIVVTGTNNLTIYGQTEGTGTLVAIGSTMAAGIGGSNNASGGTITINGGTVTATGGNGVGISEDSSGGAGIGGGNAGSGGTITINAGTVTATGKACGAGIGGGSYGEGGTIVINGGTVTATGGDYQSDPDASGGAGIGGGVNNHGGTVIITGGKITAQGSTGAAGIGPGGDYKGGNQDDGSIRLSLSGSKDYVTSNSYVNNYGASASLSVMQPDGSEASVRDENDETVVYSGALSDEDLRALAGKKLVSNTLPTLKSASLTLSGTIGVNYYLDLSRLPADVLDSTFMEFVVGSGAKQTTHVAPLDPHNRGEDGECFGFTCPTTSVQMADTIQATLHYKDGDEDQELALKAFSVKAYIESFEEYQQIHSSDGKAYDEKTTALVRSIADYGHYVQPYLAQTNNWTVGTDYALMDVYHTNIYDESAISGHLAGYAAQLSADGTPIASATMLLYLNSGTHVEALFSPQGGTSFTEDDLAAITATFVGGKQPRVALRPDGRISVSVDGVSAHQLGTNLQIAYDGKQVASLCALSYARNVLADNGAEQDAKNAMCALYAYYDAANSYVTS